jgi:phosphate transport system protein
LIEGHVRAGFQSELDQLRLQVEVMAVRVSENLVRTERVLTEGDRDASAAALAADDEIDAMLVSLTQRCYDLLVRESPVAGDLRFVVSVLRVLEELERIGDLALRVCKQVEQLPLLESHPEVLARLREMGSLARALYRTALDAWSAQDVGAARSLVGRSAEMDQRYQGLVEAVMAVDDADAVRVALAADVMGRALGRIADHTVIVGERLRYLLTGDPAYLASEVR